MAVIEPVRLVKTRATNLYDASNESHRAVSCASKPVRWIRFENNRQLSEPLIRGENSPSRRLNHSSASSSSSTASEHVATSEDECSRKSRISLEDLTDRIIEAGIYDKYLKWRQGYARWRRGSPYGARGEIGTATMDDIIADCEKQQTNVATSHSRFSDSYTLTTMRKFSMAQEEPQFAAFYPNFDTFLFKRRLAYWSAVSLAEGAILYIFSYTFACTQQVEHLPNPIIQIPAVLGSFWFIICAYAGYVQQINMYPHMEENREVTSNKMINEWFIPPWKLTPSCGIIGSHALLLGTIFFAFGVLGTLDALGFGSSWLLSEAFIWLPCSIGGVCFIVYGICAVIENREASVRLVRIGCWMDLVSCLLFAIGSSLPMIDPFNENLLFYGSNIPFLLGSIGFFLISIIQLIFWRNDMPGMMLSRTLNEVTKGATQDDIAGLSRMTIFINIVYIICSGLCSTNACIMIDLVPVSSSITELTNAMFILAFVHLLLYITSYVNELPKTEPFRGFMIVIRFLSILLIINESGSFSALLLESKKKHKNI